MITGGRTPFSMLFTASCTMLGLKFLTFCSIMSCLVREAQAKTEGDQFPRKYETFWFGHAQFMKRWELWCPERELKVRYGVERSLLGIPPVVPLDSAALKKSLGPGYKVGYFGSGFDLSDRFYRQDGTSFFQVRKLCFETKAYKRDREEVAQG